MSSAAQPAILVEGLVKRYGDLCAVNGLDLRVEPGECFGLLGPNGAGKTTTVEILEGLTAPDGGKVEILGQRWSASGTAQSDQELRGPARAPSLAEDLYFTAIGRGESFEDFDRCSLACAVWTQQSEAFAWLDAQIESVDGAEVAVSLD